MSYFYENEFSNVGRSVHSLAVTATNRFEETRDLVKDLLMLSIGKKSYSLKEQLKELIW